MAPRNALVPTADPSTSEGVARQPLFTVRFSPLDRAALTALTEAERKRLHERGESHIVSESSVLRGLVWRAVREQGIEVPGAEAPAPPPSKPAKKKR